jgi:peptidoglycan/LPS O-acetylase OafA/YrhL
MTAAPGVPSLLARFRRVTTSGQFIPEIDGLRFIAIGTVVLFHIAVDLAAKDPARWSIPTSGTPLAMVARNGAFGVQLFFVISGFILAVPFANRWLKGTPPVSLRRYYLRRLTRLEPPYFAVMIALFVILCAGEGFSRLMPHLLASLTYSHNLIFGEESLINNVAWSLEIEIQFYVLVPLLTLVFALSRPLVRRSVIVAGICLGSALSAEFIGGASRPYYSILNFSQYFLLGFLLVDLRLSGVLTRKRSFAWDVVTVIAWPCLVLLLSASSDHLGAGIAIALPLLVLAAYVAAFRGTVTNRVLSMGWLTAVGGMCYTIYLIHNPLLGAILSRTKALTPTSSWSINFLGQVVVATPVVLAVSSVLFLLIEKPCMRPDWPQRLKARLDGRHARA